MNRGVQILGFLLAITIAGGVLTADVAFGIPIIQQTMDPAASAFMATNGQAMLFLAVVGFILFNVIGAGLTLAIIFWFLNKQVTIAKEMPTLEERRQQEEELDQLPEGKTKALA
ncbi:MAG: hypothetical protein AAF846_10210 [Chloroflexota bacterium]